MDKLMRLAFVAVLFGFVFVPVTSDGATALATGEAFAQVAKLSVANRLSGSVAISGDTIVAGAKDDKIGDNDPKGAAYVFVKPAGGWTDGTATAKLAASDGAAYDQFGASVAISQDVIVVGAPFDDAWSGSVYVFVKPAGGWTDGVETAKLTASNRIGNQFFGTSVGISGDSIVVGAYGAQTAYVFVKPLSGWVTATETAKLTASNSYHSGFAFSVAISGDTIVAGAYGSEAAYVFVKPGGGWVTGFETAKLTASANESGTGEVFGWAAAIHEDVVVVGVFAADPDVGSAYVFVKPMSGWTDGTETAKLTPSDGAADDHFGKSVAVGNGRVLVGAPSDDGHRGSAYVFDKPATGWANGTESAKVAATVRTEEDFFGNGVASEDGVLVVGAGGPGIPNGATYVFTPSTCQVTKPTLLNPIDNKRVKKTTVRFDWTDAACATKYKVVVRKETNKGPRVLSKTVTVSEWNALFEGQAGGRHVWRVKACDANGCIKPTDWAAFRYVP